MSLLFLLEERATIQAATDIDVLRLTNEQHAAKNLNNERDIACEPGMFRFHPVAFDPHVSSVFTSVRLSPKKMLQHVHLHIPHIWRAFTPLILRDRGVRFRRMIFHWHARVLYEEGIRTTGRASASCLRSELKRPEKACGH